MFRSLFDSTRVVLFYAWMGGRVTRREKKSGNPQLFVPFRGLYSM